MTMHFDDEVVEEAKALRASQGSGARHRLITVILSKPEDVLLECLDRRSSLSNAAGLAVSDYTKALFFILGSTSQNSEESSKSALILLQVALKVLELIHGGRLAVDRNVLDCLSLLNQELDVLPHRHLPSIAESILAHLEKSAVHSHDGHTMQLLPRCLSLITSSVDLVVSHIHGVTERLVSGVEYRNDIVKRMLHLPWSKTLLVKLTSMLRELALDTSQTVDFITIIFAKIKEIEFQDLPALVYQLLLLASKGFRRAILTGILSNFDDLLDTNNGCYESENAKKFSDGKKFSVELSRQIQGTVLLHVNFAVKQDRALGQEIVYLVRAGHVPLTPLVVSVLLSIARIEKFAELSINLLKAATIRTYQDYKHCRNSRWIPVDLRIQSLHAIEVLEDSFIQTACNTAFGWDHVVPSVVNIGFTLIESAETGVVSLEDDVCKPVSVQGSKELGILILKTAFEVHEMARDEIIEQSKCRIIRMKPEQSSPILRLLRKLLQDYPHLMLQHVSRLKECLDCFTFLHPVSASSLIYSICPLFHITSDLQGYTILVLRKAMFSREASLRLTALQGILTLMVAEKQLMNLSESESALHSASQASSSQYERRDFEKSLSLIHEFKGILRRCLLQQANIKEALYKGVIKLTIADPNVADTIFDLLWPHFCKYYSMTEENQARLDLSACIKMNNDIVCVEEPLDSLLYCIYILQSLQPQGKDSHSAFTETCFGFSLSQDQVSHSRYGENLAVAFANLRKSIQANTLGDFLLDKTQNFSLETMEGKVNVEKAVILHGIVEVLIDAVVSEMATAGDERTVQDRQSELKCYVTLYDALELIMMQKQVHGFCRRLLFETKLRPTELGNHIGKQLSSFVLHSSEKQMPFLKPSNIAYLLDFVLSFDREFGLTNTQPVPQMNALQKEMLSFYRTVAVLALKSALCYLQAISTASTEPEEFMITFQTIVGGDWKVLGTPILRVLSAVLCSTSRIFWATSDRHKDRDRTGKSRKSADEMDGLMLITVKCLDVFSRLILRKNCLTEFIGQMRSSLNGEQLPEINLGENGNKVHLEDHSLSVEEAGLIHQWLVKKIQPLADKLLQCSRFREFEILAQTFLVLGSKLTSHQMKLHSRWAEQTGKDMKLVHTAAAKSLVMLLVHFSPPPDDLIVAQTLAEELLKVMGTDELDAIEVSGVYPVINTSSRNGIAVFLLHYVDVTLAGVEWLISKLKLSPKTNALDLPSELHEKSSTEASRAKLEAVLHSRMEALVLVVSTFAQMILTGALADHFLRVVVRVYKCLTATTKVIIAPKGYKQSPPSRQFQNLANVTCTRLTAPLYSFMAIMQRDQQENRQVKGSVSKIKREVRTIPNLIFHIEDYERYLIQLSKLTKINLMRHAKRSTARDFKIIDYKKGKWATSKVESVTEAPVDAEVEGESEEEKEAELADEVLEQSHRSDEDDGSPGGSNGCSENEEEVRTSFGRSRNVGASKRIVQESDDEESEGDRGDAGKKRRV